MISIFGMVQNRVTLWDRTKSKKIFENNELSKNLNHKSVTLPTRYIEPGQVVDYDYAHEHDKMTRT